MRRGEERPPCNPGLSYRTKGCTKGRKVEEWGEKKKIEIDNIYRDTNRYIYW